MKLNETSVQPAHQPTTTQVGYISCMYYYVGSIVYMYLKFLVFFFPI